MMKQFVLVLLMLVFGVGAPLQAALASGCVHDNMASVSSDHGASEMPCHEGKTTDKSKHCKGVCLCSHMAFQQAQMTSGDILLPVPAFRDSYSLAHYSQVPSLIPSSLFRPPISHS